MISVSWKLELRKAREENASPTVAMNEYRVRAENLEKGVGQTELKEMAVLQGLNASEDDMKRIELTNTLLRETT